jgi:DNA-binding beta-propeller fold protein YncE
MVKRGVITGLLGLVVASGAGGLGPHATPDDDGVSLLSVLHENACLLPSVEAAELQRWPEAWSGIPMLGGDVSPARVVRDPWPTFHSVAVDPVNDRVVMSDSNRHGVWIYQRTAGASESRDVTEPLGGFRGPATGMMFVASVALDPQRREIYTVDNDIGDRLMTYSYDALGNAKPIRSLAVPHQAWGIALSDKRQEVAISIESSRMIVVYSRGAAGDDEPLRVLRGVTTGLADPHGVQFDDERDELVVVNHGNQTWGPPGTGDWDPAELPSSAPPPPLGGRWLPPSLRIFRADANGDAAPIRTIEGDRTRLNWPMGLALDPTRGEMVVANNGDNSVLFFKREATGNAAPSRVLQGDRTGIVGPMNVAVDTKNHELWVSNYGDHTALVFALDASGNVAPKRIIRNAPAGAPTTGFGNPGAVTYDSKRGEIIVPN